MKFYNIEYKEGKLVKASESVNQRTHWYYGNREEWRDFPDGFFVDIRKGNSLEEAIAKSKSYFNV